MKDLFFSCPHCGKQFSFNELIKKAGNEVQLQKHISALASEEVKKELALKEATLKKEAYSQAKLEIEKLNQDKINKLENDLSLIKEQINSERSNKASELKAKELEIENKFKDQLNSKTNQIDKMLLEAKSNLDIEILKKEKQFSEEINAVKLSYEKQVSDLQNKNDQNRLIHSKIKGENFEVEIHEELTKAFANITKDEISKINITKDGEKADFLQIVKNDKAIELGRIVYEAKSGKWSDKWEDKLFSDITGQKGNYGILIANDLASKYPGVPFIVSTNHQNIFLVDSNNIVFVSNIARMLIINIANSKSGDAAENDVKLKKVNEWVQTHLQKIVSECLNELEKISDNARLATDKISAISKSKDLLVKLVQESIANKLSSILN